MHQAVPPLPTQYTVFFCICSCFFNNFRDVSYFFALETIKDNVFDNNGSLTVTSKDALGNWVTTVTSPISGFPLGGGIVGDVDINGVYYKFVNGNLSTGQKNE